MDETGKVTLMHLWEEFSTNHPGGIMYTQFCDRYQKFKGSNKICMHKEHKSGEVVEIILERTELNVQI